MAEQMTLYERGDRLRWALIRVLVVVFYLPIGKPVLRFITRRMRDE